MGAPSPNNYLLGKQRTVSILMPLLLILLSCAAILVSNLLHYALAINIVLLVIIITASTRLIYLAFSSNAEQQRVIDTFARYVEPDLVQSIVKRGDQHILLERSRRNITVLFSDIRGFVSMTDNADPDTIVTELNEYLQMMSTAIHQSGGTIDKFLGDGIMALFGAPLEQEDHADKACEAAQLMLEQLEVFNTKRALAGLNAWNIGIGIATGSAIVGSIGSADRLDYTAIGSCVNLAARLESLTPKMDVPILMDNATAIQAVRSHTSTIDALQIRGISDPIQVSSLTKHMQLPDTKKDVA